MRIGIDARMLGYSGVGRYIQNLIQELLLIDKQNQYVMFVQNKQEKFLISKSEFLNKSQIKNSKSKIIEVDAPIYSLKEQTNFLKAINRENLDLMHFTHFNRPIFYNRPSIITIHDLTPIYFPGKKRNSFIEQVAYRFVLKQALKRANKIIAVSNFTNNDLIRHYPFVKDKVEVIYLGADDKLIKRLAVSVQGIGTKRCTLCPKPYLLYVGVWREHKNILGLIQAFENVKSETNSKFQIPNLQLILVGKPDPIYKEVELAAKNSPYKKDIIIMGYVNDEDLSILYQNATALVFPSFYEGFGLPGLEAMAMSCPVVCSNTASLPEILGDAALYFDPYNINDMVDKINELLNNEKLKKELIEKGRKQVLQYSWYKTAEETLKLYNLIIGKE